MTGCVFVFSADELRGKIIDKVFRRNGVDCHIFNQMLDAGGAIAEHSPEIVVFDTDGCFAAEINHLKKICRTLKHAVAVVLGEAAVIDGFKGRQVLCYPDPIDPERLAEKAKEVLARKKKPDGGSDPLEKTLKAFLNLE